VRVAAEVVARAGVVGLVPIGRMKVKVRPRPRQQSKRRGRGQTRDRSWRALPAKAAMRHPSMPFPKMPFPKNAYSKPVTMPRAYAIRTTLLQRVNCRVPRLRGIVVQLPQLEIRGLSSCGAVYPPGDPDLLSRKFRVAILAQSDFRPFDCMFRDQEIEQRSQSPFVARHA
jgi:hypothetical protein